MPPGEAHNFPFRALSSQMKPILSSGPAKLLDIVYFMVEFHNYSTFTHVIPSESRKSANTCITRDVIIPDGASLVDRLNFH